MNFVNKDPTFDRFLCDDYNVEFYYKGIFNQPIETIVDCLRSGRFPDDLKGNFGFFYKDSNRVLIAVDHLPTYNIFYRDDRASHIFNSIKHKEDVINESQTYQRDFFWGGTVGTNTVLNEVSRIEAGTYFEKNLQTGSSRIVRYANLYEHQLDDRITIDDLKNIVTEVIEEKTRQPFNIFLSSGTDSNCILGFIKKLDRLDLCSPISLYSKKSLTDELDHIKFLEQKNNIKCLFYEIGDHVGITDNVLNRLRDTNVSQIYKENFDRTWNSFWWEPNIIQKYTALYDLDVLDKITLTGEVGDQIFGSRFSKVILKFLAQTSEATDEDISKLFVFSDLSRFQNVSVSRYEVWNKYIESNESRYKAYHDVISWVKNTWAKIDTGNDFINRIELLQYLYKASHRCYNYNHLRGAEFFHPFADYRIFYSFFKTPGFWKMKDGKTRRLSYSMISNYVDPGPWFWPKSGITLPMKKQNFT